MIPALYLDRIMDRYKRHKKRKLFLIIASIFTIIGIFGPHLWDVFSAGQVIRLITAISTFFWASYLWVCMLELMNISMYSNAKNNNQDYWASFAKQYTIFKLPFANEACLRLGITISSINTYANIVGQGNDFVAYITSIFTDNQEFRSVLEKLGITKAYWIGVWKWLEKREVDRIESVFVLDEKQMRHLPSIGQSFAYGQTLLLSKFGNEMTGMKLSESLLHFYARTFSLMEQSLKKTKDADVLLISQTVDDGLEYVNAFVPHFNNKKFINLDTQALISIRDAGEFEKVLLKVLHEATLAGNIILVIPYISSIIDAAHIIGYDAVLGISEYMNNSQLHTIMITDRAQYHSTIETQASIIQHTEKIELDVLAPEILQQVAESEVFKVESVHNVIFSYQAIISVVEAVVRFGSDRIHDTLKDYLEGLAVYAKMHSEKSNYISNELARMYISEKTGTQGTFIDNSQKTNPVDIKEIISQRVKGQEGALEAVATALERVRSGLGGIKRPLGTFLFLGPTGVGKTETAKALAEAYFGTDEKILRLDMSEFSDDGAVKRLVGSFELGEVGILSAKARDIVHGILLFDEIEKAHEKVRDLMLQILDEGYFTDARGNKVNMKNFIMIATSNAGSDDMYGSSLTIDKKALLDRIIQQGIFRPEFINRFDEVVIFYPLTDRQLASIVSMKLDLYAKSLYDKKAINLVVTTTLIDFIMNHIENKSFGGREIQRTIQNYIESIIAKDILSGNAKTGSNVSFNFNQEENRLVSVYTN